MAPLRLPLSPDECLIVAWCYFEWSKCKNFNIRNSNVYFVTIWINFIHKTEIKIYILGICIEMIRCWSDDRFPERKYSTGLVFIINYEWKLKQKSSPTILVHPFKDGQFYKLYPFLAVEPIKAWFTECFYRKFILVSTLISKFKTLHSH